MARTAEMRTEGDWFSWRPLTVAWRNCWMSSGDMAAVKRLAAHRARPSRKGDAAGERWGRRERERERGGEGRGRERGRERQRDRERDAEENKNEFNIPDKSIHTHTS